MRRAQVTSYSLLFGLLVTLALLLAVQENTVAAPARIEPAALPNQTEVTGTQTVSPTQLTPVEVQSAPTVTPTVTVATTATTGVTTTGVTTTSSPPEVLPAVTPTPASQLPIVELQPDEVLTGTIVHNNSPATVFFFLDIDLYELPPNRAVGLKLADPLAGLTLYTCAADVTEDPACDWVSYPIRRSAFYEISANPALSGQATLGLAVASAPPLGIARIQNRTGAERTLLLGELPLEMANASTVQIEETADTDGAATLYLPRCLQTNTQRICEWLPTAFQGGVYYALSESLTPAGINGVTVIRSGLEPLMVQDALLTPTPTPEPEPVGVQCQSQIPSLNVRNGPGIDFQVIDKLRVAEENGGRVLAVGRTESSEWLAVDPRFAPGGWVVNVPQWIVCEGDINALPVPEIPERPAVRAVPVPAPAPAQVVAPTPTPTPVPEETPQQTEESGPGPDQALLIASNRFEHTIRFTLDAALHGLPEGSPSEYDLEPGESQRFIIRAGRVQFSASTAWRDGSGNAEFVLGEGASRELFLHFSPSAGSNRWVLHFE